MDAIVRPQLTFTQSPPRQLPKVQCCLFATGKSYRKFRGWVSGPPPFYGLAVLPPPLSYSRIVHGIQWQGKRRARWESFSIRSDGNENHSHLGRLEGAQIRQHEGPHHLASLRLGQISGKAAAKPRECLRYASKVGSITYDIYLCNASPIRWVIGKDILTLNL